MGGLAREDYLADIYRLQAEHPEDPVSTGSVAVRRGVTAASATAMFKRLARDELIVYRNYGGVSLTQAGEELALGVVRRHRLVERFLADVLHIPWQQVDAYADQMEHALPDDVVDRMEALLENPYTCPHGYPIPDKHGRLTQPELMLLRDVPPGLAVRVARVNERVEGLLAYVAELGLMPGSLIRVTRRNNVDLNVTVEAGGREHILGLRVSEAIWVERASSPDEA